jgi:hypothetical protein
MTTKTRIYMTAGANLNIGECLAFLHANKKERSVLTKQVDELKEAYDETELRLIHLIKDQKLEGLHANGISATISETSFGGIDDFQAFEDYIIENNALYLLQRRISQAAYNDLKQAGETVPGLKDFTKTTLSLRKR